MSYEVLRARKLREELEADDDLIVAAAPGPTDDAPGYEEGEVIFGGTTTEAERAAASRARAEREGRVTEIPTTPLRPGVADQLTGTISPSITEEDRALL